jgi:hypothetical protein
MEKEVEKKLKTKAIELVKKYGYEQTKRIITKKGLTQILFKGDFIDFLTNCYDDLKLEPRILWHTMDYSGVLRLKEYTETREVYVDKTGEIIFEIKDNYLILNFDYLYQVYKDFNPGINSFRRLVPMLQYIGDWFNYTYDRDTLVEYLHK